MEIGFSYPEFNKHISEAVKAKIDYQHDYMLGFNLYDTDHMFLSIGWFDDLADDEVLVSMGYITDAELEEMIEELVENGQYTFMDEIKDQISTVDEFITFYPFQAIDDLIAYYGMDDFAMGYGDTFHRIKVKDLDKFIRKYLEV